MMASDYLALAATYFILLLICPTIVHLYHIYQRFLMSSPQTDVTLNGIQWDDFRCVVEARVTYCREPWYPFGPRCDVEGGRLMVTDLEVLSATLLDWQSNNYRASELQCEAIRRMLLYEGPCKALVLDKLEQAVAG